MSAQLDIDDVVYGSKSVVAIQEYEEIIAKIKELEAENERLKALTTWQPIEMLPKNKIVLVWSNRRKVGFSWGDLEKEDEDITHWMPLPPPPDET